MAMNKRLPGAPKGKPRGKPFQKGQVGNPNGRPKKVAASEIVAIQRQIEKDARLMARDASADAVRGMIAMASGVVMVTYKGKPLEVLVPPSTMLSAMSEIVSRGYGRPPQAIEVYGGDVTPQEREGSALAIISSQLALIGERERAARGPLALN